VESIRLLCLPHAGASAQLYARWRRRLPTFVDARPLELPGRGAREGEPFATDVCSLAEQLAEELAPRLGRECRTFAIFGHSLGALVGFELAHALRARGLEPSALLVSGSYAPTRRALGPEPVLDDAALIEQLRAYQGTSAEVFASDELLALALPVLRADFQLAAGYHYRARAALSSALHVFGGTGDEMSARDLMAWRSESKSVFTVNMFEGGHFYFRGADEALLHSIVKHLSVLASPRSSIAAGLHL